MMLIDLIHKNFVDYKANFDLHDCDNILRVKSSTACIQCDGLVNFLKDFGFHAEVLPDEYTPVANTLYLSEKSY